jgi:hypothetical protein
MKYNRLYTQHMMDNPGPPAKRRGRRRNAEPVALSSTLEEIRGALRGTAGISSDPRNALVQGFHAGVKAGIGLCGAFNTFERWRVQRALDEALQEAQLAPVEAVLNELAGITGASALTPIVTAPKLTEDKAKAIAQSTTKRGLAIR